MARYRIIFKKSVARDMRRIPEQEVARTLQRIDAPAEDPRPVYAEKLSGQKRYRVRQGAYRILYGIVDQELVITVVKVGHRREVYRQE